MITKAIIIKQKEKAVWIDAPTQSNTLELYICSHDCYLTVTTIYYAKKQKEENGK